MYRLKIAALVQTVCFAGVTTAALAGAGDMRPVSRQVIRIGTLGNHQTVTFAAEELAAYLRRMSRGTVVLLTSDEYSSDPETLWVGCFDRLPAAPRPRVEDTQRDDAIVISVKNRQGIISGANPRATLIAVYRYLTELGCRWVRAGADGEIIPALADPLSRPVTVSEAPSYRHRGFCIEGACSNEHVIELVKWIPKVGMNSYFIEYANGYIYYNNWYSERHKPENQKKLMPDARATEFAEHAIEEAKKRGLLVHRLGHGWTSMPLGIPSDLWDEVIARDFGEMTEYLAMYQGKRQLYRGIPKRTHLCYSNPKVRKLIAEEVLKYATGHPDVDYLHFWLADGANHFCECSECVKQRPADFFVMMLNEIDQSLTAHRVSTRIVFLTYLDLLWPPEKERIRNPNRFVLMFAPLQRTFYESFNLKSMEEPIPPFVYNKLVFPASHNLNLLAAWKKVFPGDSFVYDYRFMWGQYDDPGFSVLAQTTSADAELLARIGLNGMISDQTQRAFFPSGLPMTVLARKLWRSDLSYEDIVRDYYASAFGPEGALCRDYLQQVSEGFDPAWLTRFSPKKKSNLLSPDAAGKLGRVRETIKQFRPVIVRNLDRPDAAQAKSWKYLAHHAEICLPLAEAIRAEIAGDAKLAAPHWQRIRTVAIDGEAETHPAFDVFLFLLSMRQKYQTYDLESMTTQ